LTICGSLRAASVNAEVLRALDNLSPDNVILTPFQGLASLPHFNPDHEDNAPSSVLEWRDQLQRAQGVIISSPEYAHGVPGVLKNALDWVVGTGEFMNKPVLLISASPNSAFVGPQLTETLSVMMGRVHSVTLSVVGKKRDELSMRMDETVAAELRGALNSLIALANSAS
jgi:chromate reductase, NAD(P)H dehydrogenase (quinone)